MFEGEEDLLHWDLQTDFSEGGNSFGKITYKNQSLQFEGELKYEREVEFRDKLFADITNDSLPVSTFKHVNGLRLTCKTDGNPYLLYLIVAEPFSSSYYYSVVSDKSKDWVTLELPLCNMVSEISDFHQPRKLYLDSETTLKLLAVKFGIYSADQTEGEFQASLKELKLIYREDLEWVGKRYRHPVLFKRAEDYTKQKFLDTGMSLVPLNN